MLAHRIGRGALRWPRWLAPAIVLGLVACGTTASPGKAPAATAGAPARPARGEPSRTPSGASAGAALNVAYVLPSADQSPVWVAQDEGFFEQDGLNVNLKFVSGSAAAVAALQAERIQIVDANPATAVAAQLQGGDTVVLAIGIPFADARLVGSPSIHSIADLRGHTVGLATAGTADDVVTRSVLRSHGLVPGTDVKLAYLGGFAGQVAALRQGAVQAIVVAPPNDLLAEQNGAHLIQDYTQLHIPSPADGIASTRAFVSRHPATVVAFLKAYVEAIRFIGTHQAQATRVIAKYSHQTDPQILAAAWRSLVANMPVDPAPTSAGIQAVLHLLRAPAGQDPASFIDAQPLKQALGGLGSA